MTDPEPADREPAPTGSAVAGSGGDEHAIVLRAAGFSLVVGLALLAVKYYVYVVTGSSAILSDALESIANVVAAGFALASLVFAGRPVDRGHPYGHGQIEYFSAAFEGGLISFAAAIIGWYAVYDLIRGPELSQVDLGLALTLGASVANAVLGWRLVAVGRRTGSVTLVADGEHVLSDFKTSVGVVAGLVLVRATGLTWFDPLAALVVGANLAWTGVGLVRRAAGGLLDEVDPALLVRVVALRARAGARDHPPARLARDPRRAADARRRARHGAGVLDRRAGTRGGRRAGAARARDAGHPRRDRLPRRPVPPCLLRGVRRARLSGAPGTVRRSAPPFRCRRRR